METELEKLEKLGRSGTADFAVRADADVKHTDARAQSPSDNQSAADSPKRLSVPVPEDIQEIADNWYRIETQLGGRIKPYFKNVRFSVGSSPDEAGKLIIICDNDLSYKTLSDLRRIEEIESAIAGQTGKEVHVLVRRAPDGAEHTDNFVEIKKRINFPIGEEEQ